MTRKNCGICELMFCGNCAQQLLPITIHRSARIPIGENETTQSTSKSKIRPAPAFARTLRSGIGRVVNTRSSFSESNASDSVIVLACNVCCELKKGAESATKAYNKYNDRYEIDCVREKCAKMDIVAESVSFLDYLRFFFLTAHSILIAILFHLLLLYLFLLSINIVILIDIIWGGIDTTAQLIQMLVSHKIIIISLLDSRYTYVSSIFYIFFHQMIIAMYKDNTQEYDTGSSSSDSDTELYGSCDVEKWLDEINAEGCETETQSKRHRKGWISALVRKLGSTDDAVRRVGLRSLANALNSFKHRQLFAAEEGIPILVRILQVRSISNKKKRKKKAFPHCLSTNLYIEFICINY